ncbi:alpha/beta hydrolase [Actinomadura atramentaria]|uniref:alpha/beta hydrolase n=1 Tax=Actinomadura atramentaria TaxID=1990 RepID=UPI00036F8BEF|nr:alpha/beta hydrolase [Actinomadura atramentaria]
MRDREYLAFLREFLQQSAEHGARVRREGLRGLAAARAVHAAELAGLPRVPVRRVRDVTVGGVPARLYEPGGTDALLVWFHGGGWVLGDVESYDPVVRALAAACGLAVLSVEYRRPPEHRYPAAVDDAVAAFTAASKLAARTGIGGDSAGAQIAAAAAYRLATGEGPAPAGQVLVYPALDLRSVPPAPPDPDGLPFPPSDLDRVLDLYLGGADPADPRASPLLVPDPSVLPPAVVATAEHDRLRPQAEAYAARLRAAGVAVDLVAGDGLDHGFLGWGSRARAAADGVTRVGRAARALLAEPAR